MSGADPSDPLRLVVIGGGFTGAVLAIHAIRAMTHALDILVLEPRAELGLGIAFGTSDPSHRMNVPSDRMDIAEAESGAASTWFRSHGILPDPASEDGTGRAYVPRRAYGAYIRDVLAGTVAAAEGRVKLHHLPTTATAVRPNGDLWQVVCDSGSVIEADRVALCFGHSVPALPCLLGPGVTASRRFVPDPWAPHALAGIAPHESVLVVGTGLTMADVVMSLNAGGHRGPITAVSRRGLLPKPHGIFLTTLDVIGSRPPKTALELLRLVRRQIRAIDPALGWHPVIDSLRAVLHDVWNGLPPVERIRVARRLLPFWDVHRFRIAPQIDAALARARAAGQLSIERAAVTGLSRDGDGRLSATLRPPGGTTEWRRFDAVVLCTGPERDVSMNPLVSALIAAGTARLDEVKLGLAVDRASRVIGRTGEVQPGLAAFGPMTRGSFGEMTGAPDIARQIEAVVAGFLAGLSDGRPKELPQ